MQEAQSASTWKPSEQLAGRRACSREEEAAQPLLSQVLLGWSRVCLQDGRAAALVRGPIWQSCCREAALPWASIAQTCLDARLFAQEGAGCARLETPLASSWPQLCSCLAFAPRPQASFRRALGPVACTLPRAAAGRALCQGKEGLVPGSARSCLAAQTQRCPECTRLPSPLAGDCRPHTRRLTPWVPSRCLTHVASLALSSTAETCAAGWGLPLRAWAPAHSPSSGQAAPEPRPAGGAERPHLEAE